MHEKFCYDLSNCISNPDHSLVYKLLNDKKPWIKEILSLLSLYEDRFAFINLYTAVEDKITQFYLDLFIAD